MKKNNRKDVIFKSEKEEITKLILQEGKFGNKAYEYSECNIKLEDCLSIDAAKYNSGPVIIGDSCNEFERFIDVCLMSMFEGEVSCFTIFSTGEDTGREIYSFKLTLIKLDFKGIIFNWDAKKKYEIALHHKERGVELFKKRHIKDSAYRFTKGLKVILSIPLDVEKPPTEVDGLSVLKISALKANLYNNMASCYLKSEQWEMVIEFCNKVFMYESENIKALYKIGVAYRNDRNFEKAEKAFQKVLQLEPEHKAAKEHLHFVQIQLKEANNRVNNMVKKMFQNVIE